MTLDLYSLRQMVNSLWQVSLNSKVFSSIFDVANCNSVEVNSLLILADQVSCFTMEKTYVVVDANIEQRNITFEDLKKPLLGLHRKAIWETGFLVPEPSMDGLEEKWSKWLDKFPVKSIILCSSASEQFLNDDQMKQLANGLVLSGSKA
ncbi:hypothetical protein JHK87_022566 [Glycine soja]|nr:hypothetical protein JHK87_022566 [Glycine soja]